MDLLQNGMNNNIEYDYLTLEKKFYDAVTVWEFEDLREAFSNMSGYKSSQAYINKCNERIKKITDDNKELDYGMAETCFNNAKTATDFERCHTLFEALGNYKDSFYYLNECQTQIELLTEAPIFVRHDNSNKSVVSTLNENIHGEKKADTDNAASRARQRELDMRAAAKKKEAVFTAKLIRTIVIYIINIPCLCFNLLFFLVALISVEDVDSYSFILCFLGLIVINLTKLIFCVFSFFKPWIKLEEKVKLLESISNISNGFAQGMVRLLAQMVISYILYVVGIISLVIIDSTLDFYI